MRLALKTLIFLVIVSQAWAGSVRLVNDSANKLRAVIRAADGTYLGEVIVMPQRTMQWNDYWGGVGYYSNSQTPYTVVWFCADGGDFSVCNSVPSGATVTAFSCDGLRQCKPVEKPKYPPEYGQPLQEYLPEQLEQQQMQQEAGPPQGVLQ
ncbi:MAG: hypothetical protein ABSA17_04510 [Rhabdochlamydiaceae bacterium]|jgi:hypothetical protein